MEYNWRRERAEPPIISLPYQTGEQITSFTVKATLETYSISSIRNVVTSNTMLFYCQNNFVACHGRLREVFLWRSMQTFCKVSMRGQKQRNSDVFAANLQHDCHSYALFQLMQKLGVGNTILARALRPLFYPGSQHRGSTITVWLLEVSKLAQVLN